MKQLCEELSNVPCVLHCVYRVVRDGASDAALTRGSQMKGV